VGIALPGFDEGRGRLPRQGNEVVVELESAHDLADKGHDRHLARLGRDARDETLCGAGVVRQPKPGRDAEAASGRRRVVG
jgi:hypothetical protein